MRHRVAGRKLNRDSEHRLAMRRNLVSSLFEHERISTTLEKAKEVQSFAEKLITLAKKGDLAARRRVISLLGNRSIIADEENGPVKKGSVVGRLFSEIGPRYLDRPGGYTRIIKLAMNRLGDNGQVVLLQLVQDEGGSEKSNKAPNKRARRAAAYEEMTKAVEQDKAAEETEEAVEVAAEEGEVAEEQPAEEEKQEEDKR